MPCQTSCERGASLRHGANSWYGAHLIDGSVVHPRCARNQPSGESTAPSPWSDSERVRRVCVASSQFRRNEAAKLGRRFQLVDFDLLFSTFHSADWPSKLRSKRRRTRSGFCAKTSRRSRWTRIELLSSRAPAASQHRPGCCKEGHSGGEGIRRDWRGAIWRHTDTLHEVCERSCRGTTGTA